MIQNFKYYDPYLQTYILNVRDIEEMDSRLKPLEGKVPVRTEPKKQRNAICEGCGNKNKKCNCSNG